MIQTQQGKQQDSYSPCAAMYCINLDGGECICHDPPPRRGVDPDDPSHVSYFCDDYYESTIGEGMGA